MSYVIALALYSTVLASAAMAATSTALSYKRSEIVNTIIGANLGYIFDFYDILIASFALTYWIHQFGISAAEGGLILTANLVGNAIGGVIFGWAADIIGRKKGLYITMAIFGIFTSLLFTATTPLQVATYRFIGGLGMGGEWGIGLSLVAEVWPSERRGLSGGFYQGSGGGLGTGLAVATGLFLMPVYGWRTVFLVSGLLSFLIIFVRFGMPESKKWLEYKRRKAANELPAELEKYSSHSPLKQIFMGDLKATTIKFLLVAFAFMFTFYGLIAWIPTILSQLHFSMLSTYIILFGTGTILPFILEPIVGVLSDKYGRRRFTRFFMGTYALALSIGALGVLTHTLSTAFVGYLLFYFSVGAFGAWPLWLNEIYPTRARATGSDFVYSVGRGFGGLAPYALGVLAPLVGGLQLASSVALIALAIGFAATFVIPETSRRQINAIE